MLDFEIKDTGEDKLIGYTSGSFYTFNPGEFILQRTLQMEDAMDGMYVDEALRGNGIGKSLISSARVILNEAGIEEYMFDYVMSDIYRNMGARIKRQRHGLNAAFMPTANTPSAPYVFA